MYVILIFIVIALIISYVSHYFSEREYMLLAAIFFVLAGFAVVINIALIIDYATVEFQYDKFLIEHQQLQRDLEISRSKEDPYERMAILEEIVHHNKIIVKNQFLNSNWWYDPFIDDRIKDLKTIE